jgi:hypothetical protein
MTMTVTMTVVAVHRVRVHWFRRLVDMVRGRDFMLGRRSWPSVRNRRQTRSAIKWWPRRTRKCRQGLLPGRVSRWVKRLRRRMLVGFGELSGG